MAINARKNRVEMDVNTLITSEGKIANDMSKHRLNALAITRTHSGASAISQCSEPCLREECVHKSSDFSEPRKGGVKTCIRTLDSVFGENKKRGKKPRQSNIERKRDIFEIDIMFAGASSILNECMTRGLGNDK